MNCLCRPQWGRFQQRKGEATDAYRERLKARGLHFLKCSAPMSRAAEPALIQHAAAKSSRQSSQPPEAEAAQLPDQEQAICKSARAAPDSRLTVGAGCFPACSPLQSLVSPSQHLDLPHRLCWRGLRAAQSSCCRTDGTSSRCAPRRCLNDLMHSFQEALACDFSQLHIIPQEVISRQREELAALADSERRLRKQLAQERQDRQGSAHLEGVIIRYNSCWRAA